VAKMFLLFVQLEKLFFHAPTAILCHWNIIQPNEDLNDNEMMSMPLLFTSYDSYLLSTKSFQEVLNSMSGDDYTEILLKLAQTLPETDDTNFARQSRLMWQIPRSDHSTTQY
jgi:hypothetical protein